MIYGALGFDDSSKFAVTKFAIVYDVVVKFVNVNRQHLYSYVHSEVAIRPLCMVTNKNKPELLGTFYYTPFVMVSYF